MKKRVGKLLGITIGQRSLMIAEVASKGEGLSTGQMGEFPIPEGMSLEKPEELGKAFSEFLRDRKYASRDAAIGLPAKRLLTKRKDVPPATAAVANSMLRLQSESAFSGDSSTLLIDYSGETNNSQASTVLLVAATRETVANCETFAKAAGLKLRGVTATAVALAQATSSASTELGGDHGVVVNLAGGHSELAVQDGKSTSQFRHISVGESAGQDASIALAGEIRRVVASMPRNGSPIKVSIWSNSTEADAPSKALEERLGMQVIRPELKSIIRTGDIQADSNRFAPAVAVASADLDVTGLAINFLKSKLTPPPERNNRKIIQYSIAAAVLILILVGWAWSDLSSKQNELDADVAKLDAQKDELDRAQSAMDRLATARKWVGDKSKVVACLRDLTALFPDEGTIWATTISVHPDLKGELAGKAMGEKQVLALFDKMNATTQFRGTNRPDMRTDSARGGVAFSISFLYHPAE